jgi:hypothetical protein
MTFVDDITEEAETEAEEEEAQAEEVTEVEEEILLCDCMLTDDVPDISKHCCC